MRISSGVPALDSLLGGGFPAGAAILVTGPPGSGKSLLAGQFLWDGLEQGEPAVYVTLEESPSAIRAAMASIGRDFSDFERRGLLKLLHHNPSSTLAPRILEAMRSINASRVAIDPLSALDLPPATLRRQLRTLLAAIKEA